MRELWGLLFAVLLLAGCAADGVTLTSESSQTVFPTLNVSSVLATMPTSSTTMSSPTQDIRHLTPSISSTIVIDYPGWSEVYREATSAIDSCIDNRCAAESDDAVRHFASMLLDTLNDGYVEPESLSSWLPERGFELVESHAAFNLFGDGGTDQVLQIQPLRQYLAYDGSTIIVLRGENAGEFRITPVRDWWFWHYHKIGDTITVDDFTGDGQSEILSIFTAGASAGCFSIVYLYKWQGEYPDGQFVNVAQAVPRHRASRSFSDCGGRRKTGQLWSFGATDKSGVRQLVKTTWYYNRAGEDCPGYEVETLYHWTDDGYQLDEVRPKAFDHSQSIRCAVGWAGTAMDSSVSEITSPSAAIPILESVLEDWSAELNDVWGESAEDYFRFKLGTWYGRRGQVDDAVVTMRMILEQSDCTEVNLVPCLAEVYLTGLQSGQGHTSACTAVIDAAMATAPDPDSLDSWSAIIDWAETNWGFVEPHWRYLQGPVRIHQYDICDPDVP